MTFTLINASKNIRQIFFGLIKKMMSIAMLGVHLISYTFRQLNSGLARQMNDNRLEEKGGKKPQGYSLEASLE